MQVDLRTVALFLLLVTPSAAGPKSLVIALDGTRADAIVSVATPNIDRLIDGSFGGGSYRGAFSYGSQTIQDAPTSSAYNHVSIMTGVTGVQHGVTANTAAAMAAVDYRRYPHYLTTLEVAEPTLNTAYLVTWAADLAVVSGADYIKGSTDAANVARVVGILAGSFADPAGDDGSAWSLGADPDAIFLFLDDIDGAGHGGGFSPAEPGYVAQVEEVDGQIGAILDAIEARPSLASESWQIVITSDHGGLGTAHGGLNPNSETIPFLVTSQEAAQGLLAGRVHNMDAAATAVAHMLGAAAVPAHYDGVPQGTRVRPNPPADLCAALVVHLPFDDDLEDVSGRDNHAQLGAGSDFDPRLIGSGGVRGGYLAIEDFGGGPAGSSYLTLGRPADLDFGVDVAFTVATWLRVHGDQPGDSVILGNKNWVSGRNIGTLLLANEGDGDDFGFNLADGVDRRDIEPIDYGADRWWFVAVTVDRQGMANLVVASPTGALFTVADYADDLGDLDSPLPWNIGQDGTGDYAANLAADLDELAVWRRSLTIEELRQVIAGGLTTCAATCVGTDLQPVAGVTAVATLAAGVELKWLAAGASRYHLNSVATKIELLDPTRSGFGIAECDDTGPALTCTDPDPPAGSAVRYYQVLAACDGAIEGPF